MLIKIRRDYSYIICYYWLSFNMRKILVQYSFGKKFSPYMFYSVIDNLLIQCIDLYFQNKWPSESHWRGIQVNRVVVYWIATHQDMWRQWGNCYIPCFAEICQTAKNMDCKIWQRCWTIIPNHDKLKCTLQHVDNVEYIRMQYFLFICSIERYY